VWLQRAAAVPGRDQRFRRNWLGASRSPSSRKERRPPRPLVAVPGRPLRGGCCPDAAVVPAEGSPSCGCAGPRQWGGCWLAVNLWRELALDRFLGRAARPEPQGGRVGTRCCCSWRPYRLLAPGSEWRLHRPMVRGQRHGRPAGRGCRNWRRSTSSTAVTIGCSNTNKRCSTI